MDVLDRADLPFPHSLPEFQRLFPDDAACAAYLEKARWGEGIGAVPEQVSSGCHIHGVGDVTWMPRNEERFRPLPGSWR